MNPAKSVSRRYGSAHGLMASDDGSVVARLTAEIEAYGWTITRTVNGSEVVVALVPEPAPDGPRRTPRIFAAFTAIDAVRLAYDWALGIDTP